MNSCNGQGSCCATPPDTTPAGRHAVAEAWLARVAHEMRTPLNAILGYAQLLQIDSPPDTPQAQAAQMIRSAGQHLLGLATDLLDHNSLQAGRFVLHQQAFPLPRLLDDVADMVRIAARSKGLSFHCAAAAALPPCVIGDESRLRQVLLNLLANAVKFTRHGVITLDVRGRALHDARWLLRFEVGDTGVGIAAEDLDRLFLPYVRLPATSSAAGTGLGLSISRELVRAMGSDIEVSSRLGGGACFAFALDIEVPAGDGAAPAGPCHPPQAT